MSKSILVQSNSDLTVVLRVFGLQGWYIDLLDYSLESCRNWVIEQCEFNGFMFGEVETLQRWHRTLIIEEDWSLLLGEQVCNTRILYLHLLLPHCSIESLTVEPPNSDGVEVTIFYVVLGHSEVGVLLGGNHNTSSGNTLASIQCAGDCLKAQDLLDDSLNGRNTGTATNHLDGVQLQFKIGNLHCKEFNKKCKTLQSRLDHSNELFTRDGQVEINIFHQVLNID